MTEHRSAIDGPAGRIGAAAVLLAALGALVAVHWDDLTASATPESEAAAGNPEWEACLEQRLGDVEGMLADGIIDDARAELFAGRARALCAAQYGDGGGPPPPPR